MKKILILLLIIVSQKGYNQEDTIKSFNIGIFESYMFCDYGMCFQKEFEKYSIELKTAYVIGNLLLSSKEGNNGSYSGEIEFKYNILNKKRNAQRFISSSYKYRYIDFYGVSYDDDFTTYKYEHIEKQNHLKIGYGKIWEVSNFQFCLTYAFLLQYAVVKMENFKDSYKINEKDNRYYQGFGYIPSIEFSIGYRLY